MVSIIIPSRNEFFLSKTVEDILKKARGDIEIIIILDGYWVKRGELPEDKRIKILHRGESRGMRNAINSGVAVSSGEYILKTDAHCCFDEGFDVKLVEDCEDNWLVVPRRYALNKDAWDRKPDIFYDFQYISSPDDPKYKFKGVDWSEFGVREDVVGKDIVDLMTFQGSCWFMKRSWWDFIEGEDDENCGTMGGEAQELCLKTWLGGGRCVLNRKTWYAHAKKRRGRYGYEKPSGQWSKSRKYIIDTFTNNKWHKQVRNLDWLVNKFAPIPSWHEKESLMSNRFIKARYGVNMGVEKYPQVLKGMNRRELIRLWKDLGYKKGAEIGVFRGDFSKAMYEGIPELHMILVDQYDTYIGERARNREHGKNEAKAHERLDKYNPTWIRKKSEEAHFEVPDESLDFVYIDGNHKYDYVMLDLIFWNRKVRKGGMVSGHDYYNTKGKSKCNAKRAVDDYTKFHGIAPIYLTDKSDEVRETRSDKHHSWLYIKS